MDRFGQHEVGQRGCKRLGQGIARAIARCARHQVEWFWVKGHAGVADNELADQLATRGMQQAMAPS